MKYLIIGAGPAGLATAVGLKAANLKFDIVDAGDRVGGIWDIQRSETPMYKSAHFISSKTLSGFADFPMPSHYPDYPSHALVQSYIEHYAAHYGLGPYLRFRTQVVSVTPIDDHWEAVFHDGTAHQYAGVICATGITWHPNLPKISGHFQGDYIHSFEYKDSSQFRGKRALIIGAGNSGCDIACDAAKDADQAFISMRRGYYFIPKYTMGMPSDVFKEKFPLPSPKLETTVSEFLLNKVMVGNLERYGLPKPDHRLMESHPIMNSRLLHYLGHGDIAAKPDVLTFEGKEVIFEDGTRETIDLVIAATGYKRSFPFLDESLLDTNTPGKEVDLYLEMFSKRFDNLLFVGGIEVSSAVFGLFSLQGSVIAAYLKAQQQNTKAYAKFQQHKRHTGPRLQGNRKYIDSLRHQRYVDKKRYQKALHQQLKAFAA